MVLVLLHTIQGYVSEEQLLSRMKQMNIKADVLQRLEDETMSEQDINLQEQNLDTPEKVVDIVLPLLIMFL